MSFELTTLASTPQVLTNRATKTTIFLQDCTLIFWWFMPRWHRFFCFSGTGLRMMQSSKSN